jgi:hypothetical protein
MVEMAFKRVPAGYVFGAPNPWLIGARQYYLLNEQQKSEVAVRLRRVWGYLFVAIVVAVSVIVPVTLSGIDQRPVTAFAIDVLIGLAIGLALNAYLYRSIRPLLAGFAPTTERISEAKRSRPRSPCSRAATSHFSACFRWRCSRSRRRGGCSASLVGIFGRS